MTGTGLSLGNHTSFFFDRNLKTSPVYIASSLLWLRIVEGIWPDKWDMTGALICLLGASVILWGPRA